MAAEQVDKVMMLPRVLVCSQCEHGALIKTGSLARSPIITREEQAAERAAFLRHAPPATAPEHRMAITRARPCAC